MIGTTLLMSLREIRRNTMRSMLTTLGGVLGAVIGLGGSYGVSAGLHLPFAVAPDILLVAFAFSTGVGITFGYFPARKAARLNPIEALRHE